LGDLEGRGESIVARYADWRFDALLKMSNPVLLLLRKCFCVTVPDRPRVSPKFSTDSCDLRPYSEGLSSGTGAGAGRAGGVFARGASAVVEGVGVRSDDVSFDGKERFVAGVMVVASERSVYLLEASRDWVPRYDDGAAEVVCEGCVLSTWSLELVSLDCGVLVDEIVLSARPFLTAFLFKKLFGVVRVFFVVSSSLEFLLPIAGLKLDFAGGCGGKAGSDLSRGVCVTVDADDVESAEPEDACEEAAVEPFDLVSLRLLGFLLRLMDRDKIGLGSAGMTGLGDFGRPFSVLVRVPAFSTRS